MQMPSAHVDDEVARQGGAPEEHPMKHLASIDQADFDLLFDAAERQSRLDEDTILELAVARTDARAPYDARQNRDVSVPMLAVDHHVESNSAARHEP